MTSTSRLLPRSAWAFLIPLMTFGMGGTACAFDLPHQFHTLPNGLRVILAPDGS